EENLESPPPGKGSIAGRDLIGLQAGQGRMRAARKMPTGARPGTLFCQHPQILLRQDRKTVQSVHVRRLPGRSAFRNPRGVQNVRMQV
ncbi:MAG: hypothetical protein AVDCRST_MAG56-5421, partial [uncultured Cytophagales bacterium]